MRAIVCRELGPPERLILDTVEPPVPGPGQVRLTVAAAALNFADLLITEGRYQHKPDLPFIPGAEVAGTVSALGEGVDRLRVGDRIIALLDTGGFAEEAVAAVDDVLEMPEGMDAVTAAAFPIAYGTSQLALNERAGLRRGETLLIHGAAGGVGLTAVEIGKAMGATVIATAGGPDKLAIAREHGADHLIDYKAEDIRERVLALTDGRGADVIYDAVGGDAFDASLRCIAWCGRILVIGFAGGRIPQIAANILLVKNIAVLGLNWGSYRKRAPARLQAMLEPLLEAYGQGRLRPRVSATFPLERAAEALQLLRDRRATGKIVLTLGSGAHNSPKTGP